MVEASAGLNYQRFGSGIGVSNIDADSYGFDLLFRLSYIFPKKDKHSATE
ncbi:MAG: hypothetical protein V4543_18275 [Bacteroidota bacterium]